MSPLCLSVNISLPGNEGSILHSIPRLLSEWASETNLNINSHIKEVKKKSGEGTMRLKSKCCAWVNVAGFYYPGAASIKVG